MSRALLSDALFRGESRLAIIDAISKHVSSSNSKREEKSPLNAVLHDGGPFIVIDVIARYASEDNSAFIDYAFDKIVGRRPNDFERIPLEFDLRRNKLDRHRLLANLVGKARNEGRLVALGYLAPPVITDEKLKDYSIILDPPSGIDALGKETLTLCRADPVSGWRIAPGVLKQSVRVVADVWWVSPGFILAGPKRTLPSGVWKLSIEVAQHQNATLSLDIVANGALDQLFHVKFIGSIETSIVFSVHSHHLFLELRIEKEQQAEECMWLRLSLLQLTRIGDLPS
jgi:hypothetical protein